MIASIKGVIILKSPTALTVEVQGIGYQVFVPLSSYYRLPEEKEHVFLHIHTHVREDAIQLFGFLSAREKVLFQLLIGVSGVGPKLAINILSGIDLNDLLAALREGQVKTLRSIPGVGPKMAGRLALELKDKIEAVAGGASPSLPAPGGAAEAVRDDAFSALVNLGYHRGDVRRTLEKVLAETDGTGSTEDLIKEGLKRLAKV